MYALTRNDKLIHLAATKYEIRNCYKQLTEEDKVGIVAWYGRKPEQIPISRVLDREPSRDKVEPS